MKKKLKWIIPGLLILAALICGGFALRDYLKEMNAGKEYEPIREKVVLDVTPTLTPTPAPTQPDATPAPTPTHEPPVVPIDFDTLTSMYPDVYAWIRIPDTSIDYPVLQHPTDDTFYLDHNINGKYEFQGSIYSELANSKDFMDPMTVLYGHNMRNGSMFGALHKYSDSAYLKEHNELLVYMPGRILHYHIFAAYVFSNAHLLHSYDFYDKTVLRDYLSDVLYNKSGSKNLDTSCPVTAEDRILTLSTCNGNASQRYLVQCVLVSEEY